MSEIAGGKVVDTPIQSFFEPILDLSTVNVEHWFDETLSNEVPPTSTKQSQLLENLSHIARQLPNIQWATMLRDVSLGFLNSLPSSRGDVIPYVVSLFRRLIYLYPYNVFVQFALARYYLQNNSVWDGVRALKMIAKNKVIIYDEQFQHRLATMITKWETIALHLDSAADPPPTGLLLTFPWKAPSIFQHNPAGCEQIPSFIVLTRTTFHQAEMFRVDRVREFASEYWPLLGPSLVDGYCVILRSVIENPIVRHVKAFGKYKFSMVGTQTDLIVCTVSQSHLGEIFDCLAWLNAILGVPAKDRTHPLRIREMYSVKMGIRPTTETLSSDEAHALKELGYLISPSEEMSSPGSNAKVIKEVQRYHATFSQENFLEPSQSDCWLNLFERAYIGSYDVGLSEFPPLNNESHFGEGIRIPFDILLVIAGIERIVDFGGGLLLVGFCTALVPIKRINEVDRSTQWHLVVQKPSGNKFRCISDRPDFEELLPKHRMRDVSLNYINGPAYVGWCEAATVELGTTRHPSMPDYSELLDAKDKWQVVGRTLTFGGSLGFPNATVLAQLQREQAPVSPVVVFTSSMVFAMRIDSLYKRTVLIYDDLDKVAWVCPMIYLIMHMLRLYLAMNNYESSDSGAIEFSKDNAGSLVTLYKSLGVVRSLEMKRIRDDGDHSLTYGEVISFLADRFSQAFSQIKPFKGLRGELAGFEFKALLEAPEGKTVRARRLPMNDSIRAWRVLIDDEDLVFGRGFGSVFSPLASISVDSQIAIPRCQRVPMPGKDILVYPVLLLQCKLKEESSRWKIYSHCVKECLVGSEWKFLGNPFGCSKGAPCDGIMCWCTRLQRFRPKSIPKISVTKWVNALNLIRIDKNTPELYLPTVYTTRGLICFGDMV